MEKDYLSWSALQLDDGLREPLYVPLYGQTRLAQVSKAKLSLSYMRVPIMNWWASRICLLVF